jgi:3-phenylpropionate/trans-cinnamate dioxygenase ferredoxin reductase subunit
VSEPVTNTKTIAIVGAGQAGAQAAQSLRNEGYDGRLFLIGDEPQAPYQRPPLSKKYLSGEFEAERLALLPDKFYTDSAIDCLFGVRADNLDLDASEIQLSDGFKISYDQLLITTGSRSRALPIPGSHLEGVYALRSIADVDQLRPNVQSGQRVSIIGGGYIGLEVAAVARSLGLDVRVIEAADRIMARTAPEVVSRYFTDLHRSNGVAFELGAGVQSISRSEEGELSVATTAGTFASDWVLVGIGGQANVELGQAAGLTMDNGIAVDAHCQTSAANVFAAGDCTSFPSAKYGRRIRLESVQNAIDQAKVAALSLLGKGEAYDPVPWFWSDQYDTKFQIAGLSQFADEQVVRGDPASGSFAVAHLRDNKLISVDAINTPRDYMLARRMVPTTSEVDRAALADPTTPLKETIQTA